MKTVINSSLIAKLQPTTKQYDIRDSKLTGFLIRVNPSGKMNYVCEYKRGRRITIGQVGVITPMQARDKAKQILGNVLNGLAPIPGRETVAANNQSAAPTFKEFIETKYTQWAEVHRKSGSNAVQRIKTCFFSQFGAKPLSEITPLEVDEWRTRRLRAGRKADTVNRNVATFKAALSKAVEWGLIESHPLARLKLLKVDHSAKVRYLEDEEELRLRHALDAREEKLKSARKSANQWRSERGYELMPEYGEHECMDYLKPMVLVSINTGLRQGELFTLSWDDVDLVRATIAIAGSKAKSGKTRHVPLNSEALEVLRNWQNRQTTGTKGLVFPSKLGGQLNNVRKAWQQVLKQTNIENFRWHDMRHHFASRLVMAGVDLNTVRELLGHSDIKMTLRYAHLAPEHKASAVAKLVRS